MNTEYVLHTVNGQQIAEITSQGLTIDNAQQFLEIAMNLPVDGLVIRKDNLAESFFDLRSGLAGEILQKVANYRLKVGLVGDYSGYDSKALRDFIHESNKSNRIVF